MRNVNASKEELFKLKILRSNEKVLGLILDDRKLNWERHVNKIITIAQRDDK